MVMKQDKLGTYITKLMTTVIETKDKFSKDLALDELHRLNTKIQEFIIKNKMTENTEKTDKQLLQEDK